MFIGHLLSMRLGPEELEDEWANLLLHSVGYGVGRLTSLSTNGMQGHRKRV